RHPFRKPSPAETISAVLREPPDFGTSLPQEPIVRGLLFVVRRMLAKSPEDRHASIAAVLEDLVRLQASSGAIAAPDRLEEKSLPGRIPLISRDTEMGELTKHLDEAIAGRGSLVLISGEPGIGKTHLTTALLEAARLRGAFAVTGHCYEMEGSLPYVPFIEQLEHCA